MLVENRTSGSSVIPLGSNFMFMNFCTYASSGTPYCNPSDTLIASASVMPASVDPCFDTLRKISPSPLSGYEPAFMYPSWSPTRKDVVIDGRLFGKRLRCG